MFGQSVCFDWVSQEHNRDTGHWSTEQRNGSDLLSLAKTMRWNIFEVLTACMSEWFPCNSSTFMHYEFTLRLRWLENHVSNMTKYLNSRLSAKLNNVYTPRKATVRREDGWCKWNSRRGLTSEQVSSLSSVSIISSNKEEASGSDKWAGWDPILSRWEVHVSYQWLPCPIWQPLFQLALEHHYPSYLWTKKRCQTRSGRWARWRSHTQLYFHPDRNFCLGLFVLQLTLLSSFLREGFKSKKKSWEKAVRLTAWVDPPTPPPSPEAVR